MRTAHLVRRGWRATVFLALLAGLAGGVAMAAWAAGRRMDTAFDRFVARSEIPDLTLVFCPPELAAPDDETIWQCMTYDAEAELATLLELPEVEAAGRGSWRGMTIAPADRPDDVVVTGGLFALDASLPSVDGRPVVLEGRWYDPAAPDEIMVNEHLARRAGLAVGDRLAATFWRADELGMVEAPADGFHGPEAGLRVVGITRGVRDLAARTGEENLLVDESFVLAGPGLTRLTTGAAGYPGLVVRARGGDVDATGDAIDRAFAGRAYNSAPAYGADQFEPVEDAIDYETRGMFAFAGLAGLAGLVFAGQAVARQSRREAADFDALHAVGLTRHQLALTAIARGTITGAASAAAAVVAAIALSAAGTVGVARSAEVARGVWLDPTVLVAGVGLVFLGVVLASWLPVANLSGRRSRGAPAAGAGLVVPPSRLPPPVTAGVGMAVNGGRGGHGFPVGTAVASVALAAGAMAAAFVLTASMTTLVGTPEHFGAPWDYSFGGFNATSDEGAPAEFLAGAPGVAAAGGIVGTDVEIDGRTYWVQAIQPVPGVDETIRPAITSGREPIKDDEIALGALTMGQLEVEIGDAVEVSTTVSTGDTHTMTVVGTTLVNDTYEGSPGLGGVVTREWLAATAPEAISPDPYVVRLAAGADREAFRAELEDAFPGTISGPLIQGAIRNVDRIRYLPFALAALIGLLAAASLAHAVVLSTRRQRRQLAVLKTLGFRRSDVAASVRWHAAVLGAAAALVGIPLGIVAGRWGWRVVAGGLGVASGPVVPLAAVGIVVVCVVVVAKLIAVVPGWRAARIAPGDALRVE
jgi:putative ABC transport system permease protein